MMYIEGHWETINTLEDVVRVIREYYNSELADAADEMIEALVYAYNNKIEELEDYIYSSEDDEDWYDD